MLMFSVIIWVFPWLWPLITLSTVKGPKFKMSKPGESPMDSPLEPLKQWLKGLIREEIEAAMGQNGHQPELLTAEELAGRLKMPVSWVYEQSRLGNIPTHKLGKYSRFDLHEVLASQKKD